MPGLGRYSRIQRMLPVVAGLVVISTTFLLDTVLEGSGTPKFLEVILLALGCMFLVLGAAARESRISAILAKASLAALSLLFTLGVGELSFRVVGFNFEAPTPELPIFNQYPSVHDGNGILRRPGPACWRGKPLSSYLRLRGGSDNAYPDERTIEVRYDRLGFRNPPDLTDWEVVVTGDSFVESGYLAYEDIFTTVAARRLGLRIKNLGVAGTGPIFQTAYVRKYGKARSTRQAVLSFFEGNDVTDLCREVQITNYIRHTGHPLGGNPKQVSLIVALQDGLRRLNQPATDNSSPKLKTNAVLITGNREYPALISSSLPPRWENLSRDKQELLVAALAEWGKTARAQGMQPWVLYVPGSRRVLHDYLHYADTNSPMSRSQPSPFAPHLERICAAQGILFINPLPALRREVAAGQVPCNLMGDAHLSACGSRVVGEVLAGALNPAPRKRD